MPFTPAHPAAVIPLHSWLKGKVALSALVIGSVTPDAAYFLPLPISRFNSHSIAALVWFCLPVGLAGYALWHRILKEPTVLLLPLAIRERLWPLVEGSRLPRSSLGAVVAAILLGAITHLVWDGFTHADGWAVVAWPWLRTHRVTISGYDVFAFKALQHGSTFLGLALLALWSREWLRSAKPVDVVPRSLPRLLPGAICLVAVIAAIVVASASTTDVAVPRLDLATLQRVLGRSVVPAMNAVLSVVLLYALAWQAHRS